jgi:K+-sensing histidine kinase KdpD
MFDISAHNTGEAGGSGQIRKDSVKLAESLNQSIVACPSVLTGMLREMRTEMNAIVAFSFLLNKNEYNSAEREEFSEHIYTSCEKIISLFDNFLDFAIIDTGNSRSESGICDPNEVFNSLFSEFRELLKQERFKDVILVSENLPFSDAEYMIDVNRVTRVIRNLFQNALNNTKSGYIKVGYYLHNNRFTFSILDSGQGYFKCKEFLQSHDLSQSLTMFNDVFTAVNMALTRKLIHMMKGSIRIECNGFSGSGIYFSVPAEKAGDTVNAVNKFSNTMSAI